MESVTVLVPASSANLGPGFDVLAVALSLENRLVARSAERPAIEISGEGQGELPVGSRNLAYLAIERLYAEIGQPVPGLRLAMDNRIPLARGLGSSAAAIVAGLTAANALAGAALAAEDLLQLAVELEGHADNVTAALYGSVTIAYHAGGRYRAEVISPAADIQPILLVPEATLNTTVARQALPGSVGYHQVVFNLSRVALLVAALTTGDRDRLAVAVQDKLHQPYREQLVPNYREVVRACYGAGAAAVALSGAGPSLLALAVGDGAAVSQAIGSRIQKLGLDYRVLLLEVQRSGATVTATPAHPDSEVIR